MLHFIERLARTYPNRSVVVTPHPDERTAMKDAVARSQLHNVDVSSQPTLDMLPNADVCVGAYSTSLYEAASLGIPTYVLPVPGHEIVAPELASGVFRLATEPEDLVTYPVPENVSARFGLVPPASFVRPGPSGD